MSGLEVGTTSICDSMSITCLRSFFELCGPGDMIPKDF